MIALVLNVKLTSFFLSSKITNVMRAQTSQMFLGDGMGIPSITAGRILKGQLQGRSGEETKLAMDKFHHVGLSKVREIIEKKSEAQVIFNEAKTCA